MKIFVADTANQGKVSNTDFHWCENGEILMFSIFQLDDDISMCGIKTRKYTTNIVVKDIKIDKEFFRELIIESIERSMKCNVGSDGNFTIKYGIDMTFNIDDIVNEIINKAHSYQDGEKVSCFGRKISIKNEK